MKIQHQIITLSLFAVFLIAGFTAHSNDSERGELSEFLFIVNTTDNQIVLSCEKGCAWSELSFNAAINENYQAVDQFGMTTSETRERVEGRADLSEFVFKIRKTEDGVSLLGQKGTAWTALSFSCPDYSCEQAVNQYGMKSKESN